jgi:hypothetical protein
LVGKISETGKIVPPAGPSFFCLHGEQKSKSTERSQLKSVYLNSFIMNTIRKSETGANWRGDISMSRDREIVRHNQP